MLLSRRIRVLVFCVVSALATACGVDDDEVVRVKEGESLADAEYCGSFGCDQLNEFCAEVFLEFGRSPPICITEDVCERLECANTNRRCAIFDGFPGQVKCIK
ncbi:hypothetical protein HUA74_10005 [Myxococcus sp. CA051A]|uniref:Lipoprotein n=1 Tax=Myxococcus llanfairpwllgwyngyllgogerychwyrndrobwllllantysiliogogogochensis TaxID=2590453 RepID=A0A540X9M7_9BACT|nr:MULTISPECIES: hypothetical protein [unclassified Myxococcus]TQF17828.1 hypothetical protein FJV41_01400 [Myxococcus llanfairpwllgwyngyllgogerychwyrndrobwllllantysiliogogogochensis]NTX03314.1 hypothetical protein [Myxococcus sp. CA040A]NTX11726.1 hypothetical protein [Myxococcus sp. CA056]NTX34176.1 hypothetical protein [Myxococcus sp. CA033]NTX51867.1 hypothetical protein [Myxococcus sp. CA039A]